LLNANDFDGFALHAYGAPWLDANGARWDFQNGSGGYAAQLGVIDNHGFPDKPAFILEWNRQTPDEESGQEAQTAQFIIGAYQDLQTWNNNPNNHPVVCATWFIYADISPWEIFSLRGLRDQNPRGVNQDVWDSFQYACSLNISAGDMGSGPTPPHHRIPRHRRATTWPLTPLTGLPAVSTTAILAATKLTMGPSRPEASGPVTDRAPRHGWLWIWAQTAT
jgi:hypothetical protein